VKALVTGANGFVGKAIAQQLLARGDEVRSVARSDAPELRALGVDTHRGDIAEEAVAQRAVAGGIDVVFHVAAKAGVWGPREEFERSNVLGTERLVRAARDAGIRRFVFTSSPSVVFGGHDLEGVDESVPYPDTYSADYPRTKARAERFVLAQNDDDFATVALRPHLVWGPGDQNLVPRIVSRAWKRKLRKVGSGHALVDSTYIDNAALAHLNAADSLEPGAPHAGRAYFISNGEPVAVGLLIDRIVAAAGAPPTTKSVPLHVARAVGAVSELVYRGLRLPGEPLMTRFLAEQLATAHWFDISAAKRDFGYVPTVSIDEGMDKLRDYLRGDPSNVPTHR
jgi:2-alkyl-3-oxoalkanoate reductase